MRLRGLAAFEYYDRPDSVLALAGKYSRIHVRARCYVERVFHGLEDPQVLIPLESACSKTTLVTFSEYNRLLFIR